MNPKSEFEALQEMAAYSPIAQYAVERMGELEQMQNWRDEAVEGKLMAEAKYSALLERLNAISAVVDKIRYAGRLESERYYINELLDMFDEESGDFKEARDE